MLFFPHARTRTHAELFGISYILLFIIFGYKNITLLISYIFKLP
nr:MAG TPA: hypothetical protein [Caudoviricetes sp.]